MRANRKVLVEADDNILLIVVYPRGILDQQLRPRPIHTLKITIILIEYIKLNSKWLKMLRTFPFKGLETSSALAPCEKYVNTYKDFPYNDNTYNDFTYNDFTYKWLYL